MSGYEDWCRNIDAQAGHIIGIYREEDPLGGNFPEPEQHLRRYFEAMKCGDPDRAQTMIDSLTDAKFALSKDLREHLGGAQLDMDGWEGDAADDFRDFLLKLEDAINIYSECIEVLLIILRSYQAVVLAMREDATQLIDQTLKGIEESGADGWKIALAVVAAVAGVVAAIPTGGASVAAASGVTGPVLASLVAGGAGVASEVIDGGTEFQVILSMIDATKRMLPGIDIERAKIENALVQLSFFVSGAKLKEVRPDHPTVITAPSFDPGALGMTDEAQGDHKRPTDTSDLVPEPERHPDGPHDRPGSVFTPDRDWYEEQGPA